MLQVIREGSPPEVSLLDFGCGASHLYEYMRQRQMPGISYAGLDISEQFIALCRRKFPHLAYYCLDILEEAGDLPSFDYIVMNGVFTEKRELAYEDMLSYFTQMVEAVFQKARRGMAFNVMSSHVDWTRDDLFHLPFDVLAGFLVDRIGRDFVIRNDYGLYEYTVYAYRQGSLD
jgi:SAM-dependent methyltransferase